MTKKLETILEDALAIADEVLARATVISESEQTENDDIELNEDENLSEMDLANVTPVAAPAPAGDAVDESAKKKKKKGKSAVGLKTIPAENVKPGEESELDAQKGDEPAGVVESTDDIIGESADEEESIEDLTAEWEPGELEALALSEDAAEDESEDDSTAVEGEASESSKSKKNGKILCEKCNKNSVSESGKVCEDCGPKGSKKSKALNEEDEDAAEEDGELNEALVWGHERSVVAQFKEAQTCPKCNSHVKFLVTENDTYVRPILLKKAKLPLSKRYKKVCPSCKHTSVIKKEDLGSLNKPLKENTFFIEDGSDESMEFQRQFEEIEASLNESIDDLVAGMVQHEERGEIDMLVEELLEAAESGTWISGNDFEELDGVFKKQGTSNTGDRASKSTIKIHPKTDAVTGEEHPIKGDPLAGDPEDGDGDLNNDGKIDLIRS